MKKDEDTWDVCTMQLAPVKTDLLSNPDFKRTYRKHGLFIIEIRAVLINL